MMNREPEGFPVFSDRVSAVEAALTALSLRGVRKGLAPLAWQWGAPFKDRGTSRTPLVLLGDPPQIAGWTFVAAIDHESTGNVVRALPGHEIAPRWRDAKSACDHCKARRWRTRTYLLTNDKGDMRQVGSTCIGDFTGEDRAADIALAACLLAEVRACLDEECLNGGTPSDRALLTYVSECAVLVRTIGWLSRSNAPGGTATADRVWNATNPIATTEADREEATSAIAWASTLTDAELDAERGNYLSNLRTIARKSHIPARDAGLAASLVVAYQRAQARARKLAEDAARAPSRHVGAIGEKLTWGRPQEVGKRGAPKKGAPTVASLEPVRLDFYTTFETDYGVTRLCKFVDAEGRILVWFASSSPGVTLADVGSMVTLYGTVKKHDTRDGIAQTVLTRCDVTKVSE